MHLNYVRVDRIDVADGRVEQIVAADAETDERLALHARVVFNAAGVWVDDVRRQADASAKPLVTVSRGSHIVVDRRFLPGDAALMIPRTADGRVLFGIPWHGRLIVGTTDVPVDGPQWEPIPSAAEIEFILETARDYLATAPARSDVLATFAGLRPLFAPHPEGATRTISREHEIVIEHGNFVTVTGGKWTTYRRMALDALEQAARIGLIDMRPCTTATLRLAIDPTLESAHQGAEQAAALGAAMPVLSYAQLAHRHEQARSVDDVLLRRLRIGVLDEGALTALRPSLASAFSRQ